MGLFAKLLVVVILVGVLLASPELRGALLATGIDVYAHASAALGHAQLSDRPSPQAEATIALLHMINLPTADHSGVVPVPSVLRASTEKMTKDMMPFPSMLSSCTFEPGVANDIPIAWVQCGASAKRQETPGIAPAAERQVVMFCHGGGYVFGSVEGYLGSVAQVAKAWQAATEEADNAELEVRFLLFDYRLAPEVGMQEIMDDGTTVFRWLLEVERYLPRQVIVMGDSAGGNMVHNLQHELMRVGVQLPCAGVAISPWLDMSDASDSFERNNHVDPLLSAELAYILRDMSVPEAEDRSKWSPLRRSLEEMEHLAPTINLIGEIDVLVDENRQFAEKVRRVDHLEVKEYPGMFHCWVLSGDLFPEANEAVLDAWNFAKRHHCH